LNPLAQLLHRAGEALGKNRVGKYQPDQKPYQKPGDEFGHPYLLGRTETHPAIVPSIWPPGKIRVGLQADACSATPMGLGVKQRKLTGCIAGFL